MTPTSPLSSKRPKKPLVLDIERVLARVYYGPDYLQAYLRLCKTIWRHGQLPLDRGDLASAAGVTTAKWKRLEYLLAEFFDRDLQGRWHDYALERQRADEIAADAKRAGRATVRAVRAATNVVRLSDKRPKQGGLL